jgi:hypothetical protein
MFIVSATACVVVKVAMLTGLEASQGAAVLGMGSGVIAGEGPGVLEIKCPFNKGDPNRAAPLKMAQWYYMPQVS